MPKYQIFHSDYRDILDHLPMVDTMFADPPDCIGLAYDEYDDKMDVAEYIDFLNELLECGIKHAQTSYMSFNAKWMTEVGALLKAFGVVYPDLEIRWLVQEYSFAQHRKTDYSNNFRPIIRIRHVNAPLFPDAIRVESERMRMNDPRANPQGKVPGDVWRSDFMQYPRVTGNSRQRRNFCPTQLNEGLVEDLLLMATPPGGVVFDPFLGSGTTLRVCLQNGWSCYTSDLSLNYCQRVAEEHGFEEVGEGMWRHEKM